MSLRLSPFQPGRRLLGNTPGKRVPDMHAFEDKRKHKQLESAFVGVRLSSLTAWPTGSSSTGAGGARKCPLHKSTRRPKPSARTIGWIWCHEAALIGCGVGRERPLLPPVTLAPLSVLPNRGLFGRGSGTQKVERFLLRAVQQLSAPLER